MANHYFVIADFGDFCEGNQGKIYSENEGLRLFNSVVKECKEKRFTVKIALCCNAIDIKAIELKNGLEINK